MRIVTTLPSATEIVAALGCEPVGISHECDFPPGVTDVPAITSSRIETDGSSEEIDEQVLEVTGGDDGTETGGVYDVDVDTLDALDPELIVTQGMCDVCAVDEVIVADAVEAISEARRASSSRTPSDDEAEPEILTTDPHSVGDVLDDIERIGHAAGREDAAHQLRADLESRIDRVRSRTASIADDDRPRVAIFDWTDPAMIAGHWTAELVEWAGGEYGLADVGERSRPRAWEEICEYDPECIVVAPCGFDLEQTAANRDDLTDRDGWDELTAVREGRVWAMDGNHYLNRPGPRLVETLETLAPIVQPELFDPSIAPARPGETTDGSPPAPMAVPFDDLSALSEPDARVEP